MMNSCNSSQVLLRISPCDLIESHATLLGQASLPKLQDIIKYFRIISPATPCTYAKRYIRLIVLAITLIATYKVQLIVVTNEVRLRVVTDVLEAKELVLFFFNQT